MAVASDNLFPKVLIVEGSAPASPASGNQALYIDSADHKLKRKNSSGTVTAIEYTAASFVGVRYSTNTAQAVTATPTIIDFEDQVYDSGSLVTTGAAWKFTAPSTGYYNVSVFLTLDSAANTTPHGATLSIYKGGSLLTCIGRVTGPTATFLLSVGGTATINLTASEYIDIRLSQDVGASVNTFNDGVYNWVSVEKVG